MLKKNGLLSTVVLVLTIAFLAAPSLKASSENAEPADDLLCDNDNVLTCYNLLGINELTDNSIYQVRGNKAFLEGIVSYLAQHENSPPKIQSIDLCPSN